MMERECVVSGGGCGSRKCIAFAFASFLCKQLVFLWASGFFLAAGFLWTRWRAFQRVLCCYGSGRGEMGWYGGAVKKLYICT